MKKLAVIVLVTLALGGIAGCGTVQREISFTEAEYYALLEEWHGDIMRRTPELEHHECIEVSEHLYSALAEILPSPESAWHRVEVYLVPDETELVVIQRWYPEKGTPP